VRPLDVVAVNEVIELGLLLQEVAAGRLDGLELERQMHALVAAVLLRAARRRSAILTPANRLLAKRGYSCGLQQ